MRSLPSVRLLCMCVCSDTHSPTDGAPPQGPCSCRQCLCCVRTVDNRLSILHTVTKQSSHLPPLLISFPSLLFFQSAAEDRFIVTDASQTFCFVISSSILYFFFLSLTLCCCSSFCFTFCSNHFLSIPLLQSPVDSDNESIRSCFPALVFFCEYHAALALRQGFKSSSAARQHRCSYPLGRNKSRSLQSRL